MPAHDVKSGCSFRRGCTGLAALLLLGAGVGCHEHDSARWEATPDSITIQEERHWSDDESIYDWDSPASTARIKLFVDDFNHGDLRITIYDARGLEIFSESYLTDDDDWYYDDEYSDIAFTDTGTAGVWTILLEYDEFTGDVCLIVESTS